MNNNLERIYYFDSLRALAIIGVVLLHSAAPLLYEFNNISKVNWHVANIYDSVTRWSVPIFFMISGYLNLNSTGKPIIFYKKRFAKILIPFIFWAICYYLFSLYLNPTIYLIPSLFDISTYKVFFTQLLFGPIYYHLWFIYSILILYLLNPLLKMFIARFSTKTICWTLIIYFISISINNILNLMFGIGTNTSGLANIIGYFSYGLLFVGYYVLGYLLGKIDINTINMKFINFLGVAGLLITIIGTYLITSYNQGIFNAYFYHYLNFNTLVVSIWVFTLLKSKTKKPSTLILLLSKYSFGIYLIHILFIELLNKLQINITLFNLLLSIPIFTIVVLFMSIIAVWFMSKIPLLKKVVP